MASLGLHNILAQYKASAMKAYVYKDHGSLVSLSNFSTVGSLMGNPDARLDDGRRAHCRFITISLYRMHQIALRLLQTGLMMLVGRINPRDPSRLKLH